MDELIFVCLIGYRQTPQNIAFQLIIFTIITLTEIPATVLLYKLIQTNNVMRFLFGM